MLVVWVRLWRQYPELLRRVGLSLLLFRLFFCYIYIRRELTSIGFVHAVQVYLLSLYWRSWGSRNLLLKEYKNMDILNYHQKRYRNI